MKEKSLSSFLPSNLQHFSWSMQKWWWTNCKSRAESAADQDSHELPRNGNKMSITEIPRQQMLMLLPILQIWISTHFPNIVYHLIFIISSIDYTRDSRRMSYEPIKTWVSPYIYPHRSWWYVCNRQKIGITDQNIVNF